MPVPLAQEATVSLVLKHMQEISRKGGHDYLHLGDFLKVGNPLEHASWKAAVRTRKLYYSNHPQLKERSAAERLFKELNIQFKSKIAWRKLLNALAKFHVGKNIRSGATAAVPNVTPAAFNFLVDQASAAGSPDAKLLIEDVLSENGITVVALEKSTRPDPAKSLAQEILELEALEKELASQEKAMKKAEARRESDIIRRESAREKEQERSKREEEKARRAAEKLRKRQLREQEKWRNQEIADQTRKELANQRNQFNYDPFAQQANQYNKIVKGTFAAMLIYFVISSLIPIGVIIVIMIFAFG